MNIWVGILGLQGSYYEHQSILKQLNINNSIIKYPEELKKIDYLIIPGGESTTISQMIKEQNFLEPLRKYILIDKKPVLVTCAGAIILSKYIKLNNKNNKILPGLIPAVDITIIRNAYGSQTSSFQKKINLKYIGDFNCIFIRAPKVILHQESNNMNIEILGTENNNPIIIRKENILLCTFHPELEDTRIHEYFLHNFQ